MTDCTGWLCAPDGPSTPFADPWLTVIDTARVGIIVAALLVVAGSTVASRRAATPAQGARFVALAVFAAVAAATELDHLGDAAHFRLLLNIVGCGLALWGLAQFLHPSGVSDRWGGG